MQRLEVILKSQLENAYEESYRSSMEKILRKTSCARSEACSRSRTILKQILKTDPWYFLRRARKAFSSPDFAREISSISSSFNRLFLSWAGA
jgi:hypothetical protein